MKRLCTICLLLWAVCSIHTAFAQELTDLSFLKQGGYILFFRHASAPGGQYVNGGTGNDMGGALETQWWKSCDPATARQLSTVGRAEAMTIGRVMRSQGIRVGRLISSEYCRAYESAVLMNMNINIQMSSSASMVVYPDAERVLGFRDMVNQAPVGGTNTVVWTHGTNQGEFMFASLGWSDAAVYKYQSSSATVSQVEGRSIPSAYSINQSQSAGGTASLVGYIRYPVWARATSATFAAAHEKSHNETLFSTTITSLTNEQQSDLAVVISPNPSADNVLVRVGAKCDITIVNLLGQEMYSEADFRGARNLDVSSWAAGTYIITAGTAEKRVTKKFTKY